MREKMTECTSDSGETYATQYITECSIMIISRRNPASNDKAADNTR